MSKELVTDQILLGDSIQLMKEMPSESVDLIFADPPYNMQLQKELRRPNNSKVDGVRESWDQFSDYASYDAFSRSWLRECKRLLKATGTLWVIGTYHNIHRVGAVLQDLNFWILNSVVWIKSNPTPNFRGVRFTNAHETLLWAQKKKGKRYTFNHHAMKQLNGDKQMRSDWYLPTAKGGERIRLNGNTAHPTQKPEALLYRVLQSSSDPGELVLDPFFGTGTTGAVAKRLHRQWIGIERDPAYVEVAKRRIDAVEAGDYDERLYFREEPRKLPRVAFGRLLEAKLLEIGERLYWRAKGDESASVLADGALQYNGRRGSIHQIAKHIHQAPANGWTEWHYVDKNTGERRPIDDLRQLIRKQMEIK